MWYRSVLIIVFIVAVQNILLAQQIMSAGAAAQLDIWKAGENSIRITLKPINFKDDFSSTPALSEKKYSFPIISIRTVTSSIKKQIGNLNLEVRSKPLTLIVKSIKNELVQQITFQDDGKISFRLTDAAVLGMGEGGPKPVTGENWRNQKIQFDRRGSYDSMQPRWQADAYGSRNPVPMLIGTEGWAILVASPWVEVDLRNDSIGYFIPWKPTGKEIVPQNAKNQALSQGKGLPPIDQIIPGLFDVFVFDAHDPSALMIR